MKITIMGSGNIGSLFGALLTDAGEDVTLVDIRDDLVEIIKKEGITIDTSDDKHRHVTVKITNDVTSVGISDLVIIAVKSYATRKAVEDALSIIDKETYVLSVQNGVGNIETITQVLGTNHNVIGGIFQCVITPLKYNHFQWVVGTGGLKIGPVDGKMNPRIEEIVKVFQRTEIDVVVSLNVDDLIWNKLMGNSCLCMAAVLRITNDKSLAYPSTKKLTKLIIGEAIKVAQARGIKLDNPEDPMQPILRVMEKFKASGLSPKSSMLQDVENGRRTEIDAITGSIVKEGKIHNIPTPVNEVFLLLVKAMEEKIFNITEGRTT